MPSAHLSSLSPTCLPAWHGMVNISCACLSHHTSPSAWHAFFSISAMPPSPPMPCAPQKRHVVRPVPMEKTGMHGVSLFFHALCCEPPSFPMPAIALLRMLLCCMCLSAIPIFLRRACACFLPALNMPFHRVFAWFSAWLYLCWRRRKPRPKTFAAPFLLPSPLLHSNLPKTE